MKKQIVLMTLGLAAFQFGIMSIQSAQADNYRDIEKQSTDFSANQAALKKFNAQYPSGSDSNYKKIILVNPYSRQTVYVSSTSVGVTQETVTMRDNKLSPDHISNSYDRNSLMLESADISQGDIGFMTQIQALDNFSMISESSNQPINTKAEYIKSATDASTFWGYFDKYTETCNVSLPSPNKVTRACREKGEHVNDDRHSSDNGSIDRQLTETWYYSTELKAFLPIPFERKDIVEAADSRSDDGPWHSQTISAALTPEQKAAAQALFAQGFDLYKGGDFVGAQTLINKGLETDPANFLAWFTLGEINRAAWKTKGDKDAATTGYYDYQRVIDLAPKDSAQVLLATNYLKPGGMN